MLSWRREDLFMFWKPYFLLLKNKHSEHETAPLHCVLSVAWLGGNITLYRAEGTQNYTDTLCILAVRSSELYYIYESHSWNTDDRSYCLLSPFWTVLGGVNVLPVRLKWTPPGEPGDEGMLSPPGQIGGVVPKDTQTHTGRLIWWVPPCQDGLLTLLMDDPSMFWEAFWTNKNCPNEAL